jgi:hypothetical protein
MPSFAPLNPSELPQSSQLHDLNVTLISMHVIIGCLTAYQLV